MGMVLGNKKMKERVTVLLNEAISKEDTPAEFKAVSSGWIGAQDDAEASKAAAAKLKPMIAAGAESGCEICKELKTLDHYLVKRSQWIIGGDGASYDIGYGGLDHVIASGEDVNILVLDTEVYSNTGGQSSKSTPLGAIAQFAAQGKRIRKKDLGLMATTYGYVYVAQIAMGADQAQCLKAIREAEAYPGPSLIMLTLLVSIMVLRLKVVWARARQKRLKLLNVATGTCGDTILNLQKKVRIRSHSTLKNPIGANSTTSCSVRFVTSL